MPVPYAYACVRIGSWQLIPSLSAGFSTLFWNNLVSLSAARALALYFLIFTKLASEPLGCRGVV